MFLRAQTILHGALRVGLFLFVAALTSPVLYAQLSFCNQSPITIDTAVAQWRTDLNMWVADGWWILRPGDCTVVVGGQLQARYYYSYAQQSGGGRTWKGDVPFCSPLERFSFPDKVNCPPEFIHSFETVDTGESRQFTLNFTCDDCIDPSIVSAVRKAIPFLESYANAAAPNSYRTPDWVDIGPVDIQYGVDRGPLSLSVSGNRLTASVRAEYWISVSNLILGFRNGLASCGIDEPLRIADASLTAVLGLTEGGKITSKTTISNLSFPNRCELTFANIDVTDRIEATIRPQLQRLADAIDRQVAQINVPK